MGILSGNQKNEPMHYGEIFSTWTYSTTAKSVKSMYQLYENHCGDDDLKKNIRQLIDQVSQEEQQVDQLLKENGIGLPPSPAERPKASLEEIPPGAKMTDQDISWQVSTDLAAGLLACSKAMAQSTREDIAIMYGQFHQDKAQSALKMLRLNKEKGWLVPPPLEVGTPKEQMI
ncbi:DUF3231 family protein [Salipaludibacillus daqingensis]|uniref:DUF3231 family protein n=1 Tax=Salipaludibacillus daqingensis TaxID=3041001 RepID=UPI0024749C7B|nr:DUF3231 family protein [Salipaludibacillus daqingensis]